MIKPNWDIFKAKFNENPQKNFEWFCYLLFCKEFKQDKGIFRYKNQSAIETNPIELNSEVIGWQAKFYETSLSKHKNDILSTLEKAKRNYPNITKIIFYTNQEWGQDKGKKPKGLKQIEEKEKELNIELELKGNSFFDSSFVSSESEIIAKHFFTYDKSIFNLMQEQQNHTENILREIKTSFNFRGKEFEINRNERIKEVKNTDAPVIVLSGVAGVGKTAVIKKYYEQIKEQIPFYIFKPSEFSNLRNINEFFKDFNFYEFINAHNNDNQKIIVIDSAEKLLDLEYKDSFKEFLSEIINNKWKIIFTIRDNYVEVLNIEFAETYSIMPININIQNLTETQLEELSKNYGFKLPNNEKLLELIKNPFYLNEYLKFYNENEELDYIGFKNKLWNKIIFKSKPDLEQCFLKIAFDRASKGHFFINPDCDSSILTELKNNGILEYESPYGYFITHDIYEEWALEKIIEKEFISKKSTEKFFQKIGSSLPIRRSFRNWLLEKLLLDDKEIKQFIENTLNANIDQFWKDEILISVLLSDYSGTFFEFYKEELLENNQELLKRITFLLRIACKEVDNESIKKLGLGKKDLSSLIGVLTTPKGSGWRSFIKFIFDNLDKLENESINFVLPVIYDWNIKFEEGETTKFASLVALEYYKRTTEKGVYFHNNDAKEKLLQTILCGASEIKEELKEIFENILKNNWKHHRDPYYDLVKVILTPKAENGFAGLIVSKALPSHVLKLADLFWSYTSKEDNIFYHSSIDVEQYFGLEKNYHDYFPASAYQTPIYWLLQFSLEETVDFILKFTNKSIKHYANSGFDKSVKKVKLYFDEGTIKEQYISHCLWNMYRGTGSPASPYLLQSIHMALEKFFIEIAKKDDSKILESWLTYLLKNSDSASISAVVTSIVLAYPEKTYNVAKILFKTKEFILQDKVRLVSEYNTRSLYSIGYGLNPPHKKIYQDERIKTCDDEHRKWSLEELFLNYQLFRSEGISENEAKKRQKKLWNILDNYYNQLPNKDKETEEDKIWRLFLARMDRRKIDITTQETDKGLIIQFNPNLDPELKEYSEKSLEKSSEFMKYPSLKLWANYKIKNDEKYKEYKQYEKNPKQALEEVKEIIKEIKTKNFHEFHSIPAEVCSVLIRYYISELSTEEKEFCKGVILEFASLPLKANYQYQIGDGVESAITITVLSILLKEFPKEKEAIKTILLLTLFNQQPVSMNDEFANFPSRSIRELFTISFEDAQSLLFGYLYLKPKYETLREKTYQKKYKEGVYRVEEIELINAFIKEHEKDLEKVVNNEITYEDLGEIENLDLHILERDFQLIPDGTNNEIHKKLAKKIIDAFVPKILLDTRDDKINYEVKHDFLQKYAYFVLNSHAEEINDYLKPFIDNFNASETIADLFEEFIYVENILNTNDKFWLVWESFKEKIFEICKKGDRYWYVNKIIKSYLFATVPWKEDAKEWHTLKDNNKKFFKEISQRIGHHPSTLYALAKLLYGVGSLYVDDGIRWVSDIINKNKDLIKKELETNTAYYIEYLVRRYIYNNSEKIRKTNELKQMVLIILNFLVEKGSITGYMLREDIL